jgi:signal transduction histidine kinase
MEADRPKTTDYHTRMRDWERKAPWFRRISARTGLQGKLILSFMFLLLVTLGASSLQFVNENRQVTAQVLREKATTLAHAVAVGGEVAIEQSDCGVLAEMGRKVLGNGDILGVVFYSANGEVLSSTWRDGDPGDFRTRLIGNPRLHADRLCDVPLYIDPKLGPYLQATVPVRKMPGHFVGFATVALSQTTNASRIGQTQGIVMLIGAASALVSLPLVYMLVHRIFHPIRALVDATNRIAAGEWEAEVAVHRPDVIGTLARSFNEMVKTVRSQQQALESANRDLEEKVRQRTAQVEAANRRLRNEIAEKEDFLRAVSHDLNAPLRNIAGMATMLLMKHRERFDEDIIHRLERIQKNVEVETDLIGELLELSRIKTRRQKTEPVDLKPLLVEIGGLLEEDLRSRQISLIFDTPLPVVNAEPARMRQLFQNLIDNAIKYMGDGPTREIHVGCTIRRAEAEFYVRDTGIGIEPEDIDKVFFIFRRGKNATVQAVAGKGIGLASVKSIVETYEGTIWVQSEVGKGTTFRFTVNGKHVVPQESNPEVKGRAA